MTHFITVIKRNLAGEGTWRYTGLILRREPDALILPSRCRAEARFNHPDTSFQGILLKENDRFVETYLTDRWYNIYEIHDRDDDRIKGWYCRVGLRQHRPARCPRSGRPALVRGPGPRLMGHTGPSTGGAG